MSDQSTIPDAGVCRIAERAEALGVHLTPHEAKVIEVLDARQALVSRRALVDRLWGEDADGGPDGAYNNINVLVARLRRKGFTIKTHHGLGYALVGWPQPTKEPRC